MWKPTVPFIEDHSSTVDIHCCDFEGLPPERTIETVSDAVFVDYPVTQDSQDARVSYTELKELVREVVDPRLIRTVHPWVIFPYEDYSQEYTVYANRQLYCQALSLDDYQREHDLAATIEFYLGQAHAKRHPYPDTRDEWGLREDSD